MTLMPRPRQPYRRAEPVFPADFPQRIERLKQASGLPWRQFALRIGADRSTVRLWRNGGQPSGVYLLSLIALARETPNGEDILLGRGSDSWR